MATAAQAIERIAAETGILELTVFRAARALREADVMLWPQGTQGRGKAAHVEAAHLVNLALALLVADPLTAAPQEVLTYRSLRSVAERKIHHVVRREDEIIGLWTEKVGKGVIPPSINLLNMRDITLLQLLTPAGQRVGEGLEDLLTRAANDFDVVKAMHTTAWHGQFVLRQQLALFSFVLPDGDTVFDSYGVDPEPQLPGLQSAADRSPHPAAFMQTATLMPGTIEVLVNLLRDTMGHRGKAANETAASPAREAAAPDQPSTEREQPGLQTPRKVALREIPQRAFGGGWSLHIHRGETA